MYKASKEQLDQWKKQHGRVFKISVEDKAVYLKPPDRKTLSYASSVGQKDPIKFNEILLKSCWLQGDAELQTDDSLFMSVCTQLAEIVEIKQATLEKL